MIMKKLLSILFILISFAAFAQPGSLKISGVFLRVQDSSAYESAAATAHSQGYADIFYNEQSPTPHFKIWNGSSYTHVFDFNAGGGAVLIDGNGTIANINSIDIGGRIIADTDLKVNTGKVFLIYASGENSTVGISDSLSNTYILISDQAQSTYAQIQSVSVGGGDGYVINVDPNNILGDGQALTFKSITGSAIADLKFLSWQDVQFVSAAGTTSFALDNGIDYFTSINLQALSTINMSAAGNSYFINSTGGLFSGYQQFTPALGANAGLNVGGVAGNPSTLVDGDVWYNNSTELLMARINGASHSLLPLTNTAANNELTKSDGTGLVPSGLFSTGHGNLNLGSDATEVRTIAATGSGANIHLQLSPKGAAQLRLSSASSSGGIVSDISGGSFFDIITPNAAPFRFEPNFFFPDQGDFTMQGRSGINVGDKGDDLNIYGGNGNGVLGVGGAINISSGNGNFNSGAVSISAGDTLLSLQTTGTLDLNNGELTINGVAGTSGQVLTSNGSGAAPTWQTAGAGDAWDLANGGTLTGPNLISGTTTNTIKFSYPSLETTITDGAGLWLQNPTAAAAGLQQISPILTLEGNGWKTNATAASQSLKFSQRVLPVQGTTAPTGSWTLASSINAGAYSDIFQVSTIGVLTLANNVDAIGLRFAGNVTGFGLQSGGGLNFYNSSVINARLENGGNFIVGATAAASAKLQTRGSNNAVSFRAEDDSATPIIQAGETGGANYIKLYNASTAGQVLTATGTDGTAAWQTPTTVLSGTYTPTLTNVTNITASTGYECQYLRVGNTVTVSGKVDIDVTLGAASELGLSLPIASGFTAEENAGGTASSPAAASLVSAVKADATNDRAAFVFTAVSLTNDSYWFEFTYQIK